MPTPKVVKRTVTTVEEYVDLETSAEDTEMEKEQDDDDGEEEDGEEEDRRPAKKRRA